MDGIIQPFKKCGQNSTLNLPCLDILTDTCISQVAADRFGMTTTETGLVMSFVGGLTMLSQVCVVEDLSIHYACIHVNIFRMSKYLQNFLVAMRTWYRTITSFHLVPDPSNLKIVQAPAVLDLFTVQTWIKRSYRWVPCDVLQGRNLQMSCVSGLVSSGKHSY